ncbi:MAG: MarR family winged helix-turn-helix transcriptional regulator [Rhodovarius sp.]|nr:MarR family winged helix-turn-helix transcriptional regulator [Rhodovarius sp.]MCX7931497.1 MarR family winged helix-turn-helix transcriptional regulator [Rhodovarius sp.]MDW8314943.1 MarR family winged helix-turn-helix transcriptional regulator [Rhodovarius sp.]
MARAPTASLTEPEPPPPAAEAALASAPARGGAQPGVGDGGALGQAVPAAYPLDASAGHLLRRAVQRHQALFQEYAAGLGLTAPQFAALTMLAELGRTTQNRLGRLVAMDPATIQGVMRRLILRGLAATERDPLDRRALVLVITPQGRAVVRAARAAGAAANRALLAPLSEEEQALLLSLLRRLTA